MSIGFVCGVTFARLPLSGVVLSQARRHCGGSKPRRRGRLWGHGVMRHDMHDLVSRNLARHRSQGSLHSQRAIAGLN